MRQCHMLGWAYEIVVLVLSFFCLLNNQMLIGAYSTFDWCLRHFLCARLSFLQLNERYEFLFPGKVCLFALHKLSVNFREGCFILIVIFLFIEEV